MKILGLIPARGGSKGVPHKNIKSFNGKPLVYYTIKQALKSKYLDRLVVSTDDHDIARISKKYGAEVPFMRPKKLSGDKVADFPVIEHALLWFDAHGWKADYIVLLRVTNPFRKADDIDRAVKKLIHSNYDSVRAISKVEYPPYWMKRIEKGRLVPFVKTGYEDTRRQELPAVYQGNGTVEAIRRDTILKKKTRFGEKVGFIKMDDIARVDIDTELDFKIAEPLYRCWYKSLKRRGGNGR